MPKATINGVTIEVETPEELQKFIASMPKTEPAPKAKPKPTAPTRSNASAPPKLDKLTPEQIKEGLNTDFSGTLVKAINAELGFDFKAGLQQMAGIVNGIQKDFISSNASLALESAGVDPTPENVTELTNLLAATKGEKADFTLATLRSVAKDAVDNKWLEAKPVKETPEGGDPVSTDPKPTEQPFPKGKAKGLNFDSGSDSDELDPESEAYEAELEKIMNEMPEDELAALMQQG